MRILVSPSGKSFFQNLKESQNNNSFSLTKQHQKRVATKKHTVSSGMRISILQNRYPIPKTLTERYVSLKDKEKQMEEIIIEEKDKTFKIKDMMRSSTLKNLIDQSKSNRISSFRSPLKDTKYFENRLKKAINKPIPAHFKNLKAYLESKKTISIPLLEQINKSNLRLEELDRLCKKISKTPEKPLKKLNQSPSANLIFRNYLRSPYYREFSAKLYQFNSKK